MTVESDAREELRQEVARLRDRLAGLERAEAEHLRVEDSLRCQTAILQEQTELLELAHDTIMVRDLNSVILFWNRGAEETYGWSRVEALGKVTHSLLRTQFPVPLAQIESDLRRDGRWEGELVHRKKDGNQIVVASRWALRRDSTGHPLAILEINNDVTSRKQAEDALRRTMEDLDRRVHERTAALLTTNQTLTEEISERKRAEQALRQSERQLRAKTRELNEVNAALQVLLKQQERFRGEMEDQILDNVRHLILPYLENLLTMNLNPDQQAQAEIMESNLRNLVSQFTRRLSSTNLGLTPKELQIANLIRDGRSTKEIAELLHVSARAIVFHRQNIRAKLGLVSGGKKRLQAELLALA